MSEREKNLEQRLAECQRMLFREMEAHASTTAMFMLAQYELVDIDLKKEQPELWEKLRTLR